MAVSLALTCLLLTACESSGGESNVEMGQQRLVGSWLREYNQEGARVRRLLVLEADGSFNETARVEQADGGVTEHLHSGNWTFDGTNLKRKYTSADGRPPSRLTLPYATFQIRFESPREFVGTDNLRKREVRYLRTSPGALL